MDQGIYALCEKDWVVRVVFRGKEVYSSSAKDFPICLNREWVDRPFLWGDVVPWQHVCSLVHFDQHMHRLHWAQIGLSPHKKVVRQRTVSLRDEAALVIYDTTDLLSEHTSTWCPRMSSRKNWQAWHTACISRQLMCRPDSSSGQRHSEGTAHSLPSHSAQPLLEASVMTAFLLCTLSKITPCFSQRRSL